jgi:hypothetical protein
VDIWGTSLATRRTFLLVRGSSVTERVAGNADWQEKRVPRCWPSVNGGTSGLEYGAGKPPPLHCQVLHGVASQRSPSTPAKARDSEAYRGVMWLAQHFMPNAPHRDFHNIDLSTAMPVSCAAFSSALL